MILPYYSLINHVKVSGHIYKSGSLVIKMMKVEDTEDVVVQLLGSIEQFITKESNLKEFKI